MIHAREDYSRIQDPDLKIGENEPVFLLRAQDLSAPEAVDAWANINEKNNGDFRLSELARNQANAMRIWQDLYGKKPADL